MQKKLILLICVFLIGCGSTQTLVPANSTYSRGQLAKLKGANATAPKYPFLAVDDKEIEFSFMNGFSSVYLEPGKHKLVYYTKGYYERLINYYIKSTATNDGAESDLNAATTKLETKDLGLFSEYGHHYPVACEIDFESGKTYGQKEITQALVDANCPYPYYAQKSNRATDITTLKIFKDDQVVYSRTCAIRLNHLQAGNPEAIKKAYEDAGCGGMNEFTTLERINRE